MTFLGIGTSGTILNTLSNGVINIFHALESRGVPVEIIVLLLMTLESAGILIPSEIVMPLGGFLAASGLGNFRLVVLAGALGNVVGSLIAYYIGTTGTRILDARFGYVMRYVRRKGTIASFLTRLMPGVRTYAPFALGAARVNKRIFILYTFLGSFLRCIPRTRIGYVFGVHRHEIVEKFHAYTPLLLAILTDLLLIALFYEKTSSGGQWISGGDGDSDDEGEPGNDEPKGEEIEYPSDEV